MLRMRMRTCLLQWLVQALACNSVRLKGYLSALYSRYKFGGIEGMYGTWMLITTSSFTFLDRSFSASTYARCLYTPID